MLATPSSDPLVLNGESTPLSGHAPVTERSPSDRLLVSVIIPAFNEGAMLPSTLARVCRYMGTLEAQYRWEIIIVNDGSSDRTAQVAEELAASHTEIRVAHHHRNRGLGQALRTGFQASLGRYVVVLDCDLSYAPEHVGRLLDQIQRSRATIVVASPYADGGLVSHVPWLRRTMSRWANRFLASFARCNLSTLTGMVRVYDGPFIRAMSLRARGQEISPEIIYKGMLLRAQIEEIPGHLDWQLQHEAGSGRRSSMKMLPHVLSTILSGFIFSPFMFFLLPGLVLSALAVYCDVWMLLHFFEAYRDFAGESWFMTRASLAVAQAYQAFPHTFIIGGLSSMLSIQLVGLGLLSMQGKRYFEEMFHMASSMYRHTRDLEEQSVSESGREGHTGVSVRTAGPHA